MLASNGQLVPLTEARTPQAPAAPTRLGLEPDVPRGGTTVHNQGGSYPTGDRASFLVEAFGAYMACPPLAACIDVVAKTVTAGGIIVEPTNENDQADVHIDEAPPQVQKLAALVKWVNEREDMVQLMRGVSNDLDIYGDSFTEVVWALGEPVGLYSLDAASMSIDSDEHGQVRGYWQKLDNQPETIPFDPHEVIHVSNDNARGALYGTGLVQKAFWPVTTYLFAAGLLKERMRKGDPPNLHVDAPIEVDDNDTRKWSQQYKVKNIGAANIGNPVLSRGGFNINELKQSATADLVAIMVAQRDIIVSLSGVPPFQVGIIESGNLGGGTGSSQWKGYILNTVAPRDALIMEKYNFALCAAFGIEGWKLAFGNTDYRDDAAVEDIRIKRLQSGIVNLNETRADLNLPSVEEGGDDHIIVERSYMMTWKDAVAYAQSLITKNQPAPPPPAPVHVVAPALPPGAPQPPEPAAPEPTPPAPPAGTAPEPAPAETAVWQQRVREHYQQVLAQLPSVEE